MSEPAPQSAPQPVPYARRAAYAEPAADLPGTAPAPAAESARAEDETVRPEPLGVTVAATGNADVDAALARLADADALPTQAHTEVYEDVHGGLRDALTALDENRS
jgi:hypothetical protein